ncbi:hypothetical protein [Bernardetia litoralis]|uniref:hypothetical protein n=1 Tax=Bernardetia litoralis TaxID=999 RepID=UPI00059D1F37|nr:hypothetical protein [Bernardetia litoralis]
MKHLQKPIFPLFILVLILSAFGYREFLQDYTKTEKEILKYSYEQNQTIKNEFLSRIGDKKRQTFGKFKNGELAICLKDDFDRKIENMEKIYLETVKKYFIHDGKNRRVTTYNSFSKLCRKGFKNRFYDCKKLSKLCL